ncbi:MAG: hypothetical protein HYX62_10270 [Gammaproteobacteria bacterium]|nr:hypothetical protein [Gammaproteobacteria bacterium]
MASKERPNGYWSTARIRREARKYDFRGDFMEHANGAYSAAVDKKILGSVCAHMPKRKRTPRKWPPKWVISEAKRFDTSAAFQAHSPGAYRAAIRLGIIRSISAHMVPSRAPKGFWTEQRIRTTARKYRTRATFRRRAPHAYAAATKNRIMDAVCGHMQFIRHPDWRMDEIAREARNYSSRSEFEHGNRGAYKAAHRRNLLDAVCGHMRQRGHRYRRAIYIYEFADKSALPLTEIDPGLLTETDPLPRRISRRC